MKSRKSSSNFFLLENVLRDVYADNQGPSQLKRDLAYAFSRYTAEGVPFLSVTLPILGKALLAGLETGNFVIPSF